MSSMLRSLEYAHEHMVLLGRKTRAREDGDLPADMAERLDR